MLTRKIEYQFNGFMREIDLISNEKDTREALEQWNIFPRVPDDKYLWRTCEYEEGLLEYLRAVKQHTLSMR